MKSGVAVGLAALMLTSACDRAAPDEAPDAATTTTSRLVLSGPDEAAVRVLAADFVEAWNRHDMAAMRALNTGDVEWVNVTGNHWRGLANVYKAHDNLHRVLAAETSASVEAIALRAIAPDAAVAVATLHFGPMMGPDGKVIEDRKTRASLVAVKRDGVWKIVHFHNTNVDALAEGPGDPLEWDETGLPPQLRE